MAGARSTSDTECRSCTGTSAAARLPVKAEECSAALPSAPTAARERLTDILKRTPEDQVYDVAADALGKIFGTPVEVSQTRSYNGEPRFEIKVGSSQQSAQEPVYRLLKACNEAEIDRDDLDLRTDHNGNIYFSAGDLFTSERGRTIPKDAIFEALETNADAFRAAVTGRPRRAK